MTPIERAKIRGESGCDESTIKKYPNVSAASRLRIERAAAVHGIELPRTTDSRRAAATSTSPPPSGRAA